MATYNTINTIKEASDAYFAAKAKGDAAGMKAANDAANAIRASNGEAAQYATADINSVAKKNTASSASGALQSAVSSGMQTGGSSYGGSATGVGTYNDNQAAIKAQMNANSQEWHTADAARKKELEAANKALAYQLGGDVAFDPQSGTWSGSAQMPLQLPEMNIAGFDDWMNSSGYGAAMDSIKAANEAYLKKLEEATAQQAAQVNQGYDEAARQAYVSNMLSRRTLPQRMSAAGMNGGLADSQQIALDAELQNNQNTLNIQRQTALQQLQSALAQNKLAAQQDYLGNLMGLQQNAAGGYQNYYQNQQDRILNNYYNQQEMDAAKEQLAISLAQQDWERAYQLMQLLGYADDQIAQVLGIQSGAVTNDADYRAAQLQMALMGY